MAEDLWTTINRYMYHEKKFSFSNSSSYEWFIFEWFMKVEFSREHVDDVIEDAVFTTGIGRNTKAMKEKDLIPADSYVNPATVQSPFKPRNTVKEDSKTGKSISPSRRDNRSYVEVTKDRIDQIVEASDPESRTRGGKPFLKKFAIHSNKKKSEESDEVVDEHMDKEVKETMVAEDHKKENESIKDARMDSHQEKYDTLFTMENYRKALAQLMYAKGSEAATQLEYIKLMKEQIVMDGKFVSSEAKHITSTYDLKLYELKCNKMKKASDLLHKHVNINIITVTMGKYQSADPNVIWQGLMDQFRTNEADIEAYMRDAIASFTPNKGQSFEDFMRVIDVIYQIIKNVRGHAVSTEKKKENLRLIMNQQKSNNPSFQVLRVHAFINKNLDYDDMLRTLLDIDNDDRNNKVEELTRVKPFKSMNDRSYREYRERPPRDNYRHINFMDKTNDGWNKRNNNYNNRNNNYGNNFNNKDYKFRGEKKLINKQPYQKYTKDNTNHYNQRSNNKSYHKPYTQGDRYTTTRQNNSPSQNNQNSDKSHKKQTDTNKDSSNNVLCFEVLDGEDMDEENEHEHVTMMEEISPLTENNNDESNSNEHYTDINENDEDEINEDVIIETEVIAQLDKIQKEFYHDMTAPIPIDSQFRKTYDEVIFGYRKMDLTVHNYQEYHRLSSIQKKITSYIGRHSTDYDIILAIIAYPKFRKVLHTNHLPHELRLKLELFSRNFMKYIAKPFKDSMIIHGYKTREDEGDERLLTKQELHIIQAVIQQYLDRLAGYASRIKEEEQIEDINSLNRKQYDDNMDQTIKSLGVFVYKYINNIESDDFALLNDNIPTNYEMLKAHETFRRHDNEIQKQMEKVRKRDEDILKRNKDRYIVLTEEEQEKYKEKANKEKKKIYSGIYPNEPTYIHMYKDRLYYKHRFDEENEVPQSIVKNRETSPNQSPKKEKNSNNSSPSKGSNSPNDQPKKKHKSNAATEKKDSPPRYDDMRDKVFKYAPIEIYHSNDDGYNHDSRGNQIIVPTQVSYHERRSPSIDTPRRSPRIREKEQEQNDKEGDESDEVNDNIRIKSNQKRRHKKHHNINLATIEEDIDTILYTQNAENDIDIIIDSGATIHMFRNPSLLFNIRHKKSKIKFGNGSFETYNMVGDAGLLKDIVFSTKASKNIVSIGRITDMGYIISIQDNRAFIRDQDNNTISTATKRNDGLLYLDDMNLIAPLANECNLTVREEINGATPNRMKKFYAGMNVLNVLHNRFGHINEGAIKAMISSKSVIGAGYAYEDIKNMHMEPCEACMKGKMIKLPAHSTLQPTKYKVFEKIGSDIAGNMRVMSIQGNKYLILYVDYHSSFIIPYFVRRKSELLDTFKELHKEILNRGHRIAILQSDSESVFKDGKVIEWCDENGIESQYSPAYFHEANGKVERSIRTIVTMARTMMVAKNVPANLWQYAVTYAVKIHNRTPLRSLQMKTPYEEVFEKKPDISAFIPFYARGWSLIYKDEKKQGKKRGKFDPVSEPCRFLGLPNNSKNTFIVRMDDGRVMTRRDCQFDEHDEEKQSHNTDDELDEIMSSSSEGACSDSCSDDSDSSMNSNVSTDNDSDEEDNKKNKDTSKNNNDRRTQRHQQSIQRKSKKEEENKVRRSGREKQIPQYLKQYVYTVSNDITIDIPTPKSVKEALHPNNKHRDDWKKAIDKEMSEMWSRGSLVKVELDEVKQNNRKPFKSKFVFKVKNEPDGSIRFKARLVGCGYSQIKGIDYTNTYSPTPGFHLVILILHISTINNWNVIANDIGNAYLEAHADTLLYMNLPKDYTNGIQQVVRLDGNINGTKQGALLWANVIDDVLIKFKCVRSKIEPCLYIYKEEKDIIYIIVYVDDILMTGNNNDTIEKLQKHLANSFKKVTNQGEVRKFLGVQIKREEIKGNKYLLLHHNDYIADKVKNINNIRTKNTPLPINLKQLKDDNEEKVEPIHDLVGQIRFLADRCRPDIAFAASFLARFSTSATQTQINACHRVLHYLNTTINEGIRVGSKSKEIVLTAYADASFATEDDSKSQLSYALYLSKDSGTCLFKSWKDKAVSTSSTHSEIHALFETIKTIIWYRELLSEIGFNQSEPTIIYQDNINVVNLSNLSAKDNMTKFLINKINFIREAVNSKIILLKHINTEYMIADIGTKSLETTLHNRLKEPLLKGYELLEQINQR